MRKLEHTERWSNLPRGTQVVCHPSHRAAELPHRERKASSLAPLRLVSSSRQSQQVGEDY